MWRVRACLSVCDIVELSCAHVRVGLSWNSGARLTNTARSMRPIAWYCVARTTLPSVMVEIIAADDGHG